MCWKESLTIKGSAIYQLTNCSCIFLHYLIELLHTSNIILRLYVSVIIRIDCYIWLECMVIIKYLVGKRYFDDESGHLYEVESVLYDEEHKAVIAYRRAMDGKTRQLNDSPFLVYGDGGVLQLCELWDENSGQGGIKWPDSEAEWAAYIPRGGC